MKCPACETAIHPQWTYQNAPVIGLLMQACECPACEQYLLYIAENSSSPTVWRRLVPPNRAGKSIHSAVPESLQQDYREAFMVLDASPKAAAALARRCIQAILREIGYEQHNLVDQIRAALNEAAPAKALPAPILETLDATRNFGNFAAHPMTDRTTLQITEVEPEEAEWCLEIVEAMFDAVYARPADSRRRKAELNAKLTAAGKPPSL